MVFEPCWPHRMGRFFLLTQLVNEIKDSDVNSLSLLHFNNKIESLSFLKKDPDHQKPQEAYKTTNQQR